MAPSPRPGQPLPTANGEGFPSPASCPPSGAPGRWVFLAAVPRASRRDSGGSSILFTQRGESMNSLLLVVLVSCPPVAAYPDAGPAQDGSSHQGRPLLFGWLRGHHHHNKYPSAGNGYAGGSWPPVAAAPAPGVEAGTVEALTLEPAPTVVPPPACHCAGNGHAGGSWPPAAGAPAPPVVLPPASAGPAPRPV